MVFEKPEVVKIEYMSRPKTMQYSPKPTKAFTDNFLFKHQYQNHINEPHPFIGIYFPLLSWPHTVFDFALKPDSSSYSPQQINPLLKVVPTDAVYFPVWVTKKIQAAVLARF